ncbi:MAG: hypothetical protein IPN34_01925 [Planctomycetes bacterium]|nr:hypothetical protein [Planctomycetota bacterium]
MHRPSPRLRAFSFALFAFFLGLAPSAAHAQDLKGAVDTSLRWLREHQKQDGAWGSGLEDTSLALYAFATSHRKYTVWDGPWLRRGVDLLLAKRDAAKGSIGSARETLLAALAIEALKTDVGSAVVEDALRFAARELKRELPADRERAALEGFVRTALGDNVPPAEPDSKAAAALGQQLMEQRDEAGSFGGEVRATILGVLTMNRCLDAQSRKKAPKNATPKSSLPAPKADYDLARMRENAARFLLDPQQRVGEMWGFGPYPDLGITGMVIGALQAIPSAQRSPQIEAEIGKGLDKLAQAQRKDGSIHNGQVVAYTTSVAVLALSRSTKKEHQEAAQRGRAYLTQAQSDEGEGYGEDHKYYGGIGYGGDERPDLSNLQMAMDALAAAGADAQDDAVKKALVFLQRVQNRSESNPGAARNEEGTFVAGNDGGGIYAPGESPAGTTKLADGRKTARSYGSMTYALLKGFLYAGLPKDDARVKAAFEWIQKNYSVDENPGFELSSDPDAAAQGYFYYLHTMARTLDLYGGDTLTDVGGRTRAWRKEIAARLGALQRADGSWVNDRAERWWEGNPVLATAYALLALEYCR